MPLGYFELKEINTLKILPDNYFSNRKNILEIKVNSFYKKNILKGERTFYFSTIEINKIYEILISLNFLRVKSIYDDFTKQFGTIPLPMNHEIRVSHKAKLKMKINLDELKNNDFINNYNNPNSNFGQSVKNNSRIIKENSNTKISAKKRNSLNDFQLENFMNSDNSNKLPYLKDDIKLLWIAGVITLIANIQKRIIDGYTETHLSPTIMEIYFIQDKINLLFELEFNKRYLFYL
jgi:hypothetical protein